MILDEADIGGSLYTAGPAPSAQQQQPAKSDAAPSPVAAVNQSLAEVLPPDPSQSKLPVGLAVLGLCIFGVIWANSIDQKVGKK